jgi:hypothetical protein
MASLLAFKLSQAWLASQSCSSTASHPSTLSKPLLLLELLILEPPPSMDNINLIFILNYIYEVL